MTDAAVGDAGSTATVTTEVAASARAGEARLPPVLTGAALWTTGLLLALANFIALLDTTIANVSVPNIAGGLGVSANEGTWVITSYSVAEAITVPLTGWLAQRFGSVRVFVTAMTLFGLFSALCGLAPSLNLLVVCRVLQGLSGGPMIPLSQTLLLRVFPKHLSGQAMGLWGMTTVVAPVAGPILGGTLCDTYSWPWVFYINVPVAMLTAFLALRALRPFEDKTRKAPIDLVGLGLMIVWIGALQIMLDKGEEDDWFNSSFIVTLAITTLIGFVAWLIWEATEREPIVNIRLFLNKNYAIAFGVLCLCFGSYFASVVIQPLWLQTNLGYTATWAGYAVAPSGVLAIILSPVAGRLLSKVDPRLMLFLGVSGAALTMFWRAGFASNINFLAIALPQLVTGGFMIFFFIPVFGLGLGQLKPQEMASGAGILSFGRTMAGAFGASLATTAWSNGARTARVQLLNQTDTHAAVQALTGVGLSLGQATSQFEGIVQGQAVMLATDKVFATIGVLMLLAACSIWLTSRPRGGGGGGGGH